MATSYNVGRIGSTLSPLLIGIAATNYSIGLGIGLLGIAYAVCALIPGLVHQGKDVRSESRRGGIRCVTAKRLRHHGAAGGSPAPAGNTNEGALLVAQRDDRIHIGGSSRWKITGHECDRGQDDRDRGECHAVGRADAEEQAGHDSRQRRRADEPQQRSRPP